MEQYIKNLPFFLIATSVGIVANFLFVTKQNEFTRLRITREVFGGLWISAVAYIGLDEMTTLSDIMLFAITSIIGFINSRIISFIGKDLMEAIGKNIVRALRNLADRLKSNKNDWDGRYDDDENVG